MVPVYAFAESGRVGGRTPHITPSPLVGEVLLIKSVAESSTATLMKNTPFFAYKILG